MALAPAAAHANSGIGLFMPANLMNVLALIPVVIIEGMILCRLLGVRARRGFYLSLIANLASLLLGFAIGVPFDIMMGGGGPPGSGGGVAFSLFVMFWLTWWVEAKVVRRMQKASDPQVKAGRATLLANVVSYALLIGLALFFIPGDPYPLRARLSEVISTLKVNRDDVAQHYAQNGRFPETFKPGLSQAVRSIRLAPDGRLIATVDLPRYPEAHGKEIIVTPRIADGKIISWTCHATDIEQRFMPSGCRDVPGARR